MRIFADGGTLNKTLTDWTLDGILFLLALAGTHIAQSADRPITAVLICLVGVILIAVHSGLIPALIAAISASLIYNFFLSQPIFQFGLTTLDEAVPLIAFNLTALLAGILVGRLRDTADRASRAQSETEFLLAISDRLQTALKLQEVEDVLQDLLPSQGVETVKLFIGNGGNYRRPASGEVMTDGLEPILDGVAEGRSSQSMLLEMVGARGTLGLVKYEFSNAVDNRPQAPDLKSISALIGLAVERCLLLEEVAETRAQVKSETLKDSLLSSVSHDLRTPITVIEAAAGALVSPKIKLPDDQRKTLLESIIEQCHRLDRYTSELLDVSQIKAGISGRASEVVDLRELAALAARQLRTLHDKVELERDFDDAPVFIKANPALIEQAIFNLLDNARKYGGDGPVVLSVSTAEEDIAELAVTDCGDGVEGADKERMFERFFKSAKHSNVTGSGLGLFIAKGFVEASGGRIEVESPVEEGSGTRIWLRFALCDEQARADGENRS